MCKSYQRTYGVSGVFAQEPFLAPGKRPNSPIPRRSYTQPATSCAVAVERTVGAPVASLDGVTV